MATMETPARELFAIGDRVQLTEWALKNGFNMRSGQTELGTVVGYGRGANLIRVKRDGVKTVDSWSIVFWEHVTESRSG